MVNERTTAMKTALLILGFIASSAFAQEAAIKDAAKTGAEVIQGGRAATAGVATAGARATVSVADAIAAIYQHGLPSAQETAHFKSVIADLKLDANSNQTLSDAVDFTV